MKTPTEGKTPTVFLPRWTTLGYCIIYRIAYGKYSTKAPYVCMHVCFLLLPPLVGGLLPKDVASLLSDEVLPFTPVYTCTQIYVCMCIYMCVHACMYIICMYVYMYERRYVPMNCVDTSTIFSLMTTNSLNLEESTWGVCMYVCMYVW